MPCYHPMPAVRLKDGSVKFVSRSAKNVESSLDLPCGQCVGCRLERSRQWAVRCMHEASLHDSNAFVTLTYRDECLPPGGSLRYRDFQLFMKRLRRRTGVEMSYYVGGEYGEQLSRPHFHCCLFGYDFPDKQHLSRSSDGSKLYTSAFLEEVWGNGMCSTGDVSFASAAYIARYCVAKVNGQLAAAHYTRVTDDGELVRLASEFNHMSLKPAVGKRWLEKYRTDVYPRDYVIVNGVKTKPPKAYDRWFEEEDPITFDELRCIRELDATLVASDNSYARLAVKEQVAAARVSLLKRSL